MKDYIVPNVAFSPNHYDMHKIVKEIYPDHGVLFRVEGRNLRIRAPHAPGADWSFKTESIYIPKKNEIVEFELTANLNYKRRSEKNGWKQKRLQMRSNSHAQIDDWLWKRCLGFGFAPVFYNIEAEELLMDRKDKIWMINSTDFSGTLEVRDANVFEKFLFYGFSQAKAFGFGLMTTHSI